MAYHIGAIDALLRLNVGERFIDAFMLIVNGWSVNSRTVTAVPPELSVTHDGETYIVASKRMDAPMRYADAADAMQMLILELITIYCLARPDLFIVHAGAAKVQDKLIVVPAAGKAGKSTLIATLGAAGATIWTDDALPVSLDRRSGISLGIAPSPRHPWPATFAQTTRSFLDRHTAIANERFAYIALPAGRQAPIGAEKPIGAFVLPERVDEAPSPDPVELAPATRAETMARLIGQHLGEPPPARAMVEKLAALLADVPCWRLKYREADAAARYLAAHPPFAA